MTFLFVDRSIFSVLPVFTVRIAYTCRL